MEHGAVGVIGSLQNVHTDGRDPSRAACREDWGKQHFSDLQDLVCTHHFPLKSENSVAGCSSACAATPELTSCNGHA